jgi:sortase A
VARKQSEENLSVDELRHLLVEKRRMARQDRLDHFRRTGRVIMISPEPTATSPETLHTDHDMIGSDTGVEEESTPKKPHRGLFFDRLLLLVEIGALIGLGLIIINVS